MRSSQPYTRWFSFAWRVGLGFGLTMVAHAQTGTMPKQPSQAATDQSSYTARILNRRGVREVDPNVYAYNAEFAQRFQMPQEWISDELKGADAVAFRVVPGHKSCGWGGDPQSCREDEVRCELDLYFDHQRNPLPWDERMSWVQLDRRHVSADFLASIVNPLARVKGTGMAPYRAPFASRQTGKEMTWKTGFSNSQGSGSSYLGLVAYDRELFANMSVLVFSGGCASEYLPQAIWLDEAQVGFKERFDAYKSVELPVVWGDRVRQLLIPMGRRDKSFYKELGENALKEIKDSPISNKAIEPLK